MWNKCVFITRLQTYWCTHTFHKSIFNNRLHTQGIYKKKKIHNGFQIVSPLLLTYLRILNSRNVLRLFLDTVTIICKNIIFCPLFGLGCEAKHYCCNYRVIGVRLFIVYKIIASFFQFLKKTFWQKMLSIKKLKILFIRLLLLYFFNPYIFIYNTDINFIL